MIFTRPHTTFTSPDFTEVKYLSTALSNSIRVCLTSYRLIAQQTGNLRYSSVISSSSFFNVSYRKTKVCILTHPFWWSFSSADIAIELKGILKMASAFHARVSFELGVSLLIFCLYVFRVMYLTIMFTIMLDDCLSGALAFMPIIHPYSFATSHLNSSLSSFLLYQLLCPHTQMA